MNEVITQLTAEMHSMHTKSLRAIRGDTAHILEVRLSENGQVYEISGDCYAVIMGRKPDGTSIYNSCTIENNAIIYAFTAQTISCSGSFPVQIRLYGADQKIITTVPIQMEVYETAFDAESAVKSADEQTALDDLTNRTRALELDIIRDRESRAFRGESAYELARRLGFTGTEQEWIESLKYDHSEEFTTLANQVREDSGAATAAAGTAASSAESAGRDAASALQDRKAAEIAARTAADQAASAIKSAEAAGKSQAAAAGSAA